MSEYSWEEDTENRTFGVEKANGESIWIHVGEEDVWFESSYCDGSLQVSIPALQAKNILEAVLERIETRHLGIEDVL